MTALDNVSIDIHSGEFTAIMGPSGSGKSTLMHCMAGLDAAEKGSVKIGDAELANLKDKELTRLRREKVGFIFQAFNLVPTLNAEENILLPLSIAGKKPDMDWFNQVPASCPEASNNVWPVHVRSLAVRRSCLPTNRPETWTRLRAPKFCDSCAAALIASPKPSSW